MGRIYSPYQTGTFAQCPMKWIWQKEGWAPKEFGNMELAGLVGQAFAAGIARLNRQAKVNLSHRPTEEQIEASVVRAEQSVVAGYEALIKSGRTVEDGKDEYVDVLPELVGSALRGYWNVVEYPDQSWRIRDVEKSFPEYGYGRLDVSFDTIDGPVIVDYKVKRFLAKSSYYKTVLDYYQSWQLKHYCWMYSDYVGEFVGRAYIALVVIEPKVTVEFLPQFFSPETMQVWLESAQDIWADMEAVAQGRKIARQAVVHNNSFGLCEMAKACFDYQMDENLMLHSYHKKVR